MTTAVSELHPLRILQLSDLHLFADSESYLNWGETPPVNPATQLETILSHVQQSNEHYDAVLITGDIAQTPTIDTYLALPELLAPLNLPVYLLPGNHDDRKLLSRLNGVGCCSTDPVIVSGSWAFFLLDSSLDGRNFGYLHEPQLQQLERNIQTYSHLNQLIALHHHPIPVNSPWLDEIGLSNADELFSRITPYSQVKGIVSGHVHLASETDVNGIHVSTCPATCVQFERGSEQQTFSSFPPGYRSLTLHSDGKIETRVLTPGASRNKIAI